MCPSCVWPLLPFPHSSSLQTVALHHFFICLWCQDSPHSPRSEARVHICTQTHTHSLLLTQRYDNLCADFLSCIHTDTHPLEFYGSTHFFANTALGFALWQPPTPHSLFLSNHLSAFHHLLLSVFFSTTAMLFHALSLLSFTSAISSANILLWSPLFSLSANPPSAQMLPSCKYFARLLFTPLSMSLAH